LLSITTGHWDAIENGTHHVRDTTFKEEACHTLYSETDEIFL